MNFNLAKYDSSLSNLLYIYIYIYYHFFTYQIRAESNFRSYKMNKKNYVQTFYCMCCTNPK